jgi:hypothetical protein
MSIIRLRDLLRTNPLSFFAVFLPACILYQTVAMADTYQQQTPSSIPPMTSETTKSAPDGTTPNTRPTIGLGETVTCKIDATKWVDGDYDVTTSRVVTDTIGNRVWASSGKGSITPSGVTTDNSVTLTAAYDAGVVVVLVHVYDSGTKFSDPYVESSRTFNVIKPTADDTFGDTWNSCLTNFTFRLLPLSVSFEGLSVSETTGTGSTDYCWFSGGPAPYDYVTGGLWTVGSGNVCDPTDNMGWGSSDISYYRNNPSPPAAPCLTHIVQNMSVVQGPTGQYTQNVVEYVIGPTTLTNTRGNHSSSRTWP